MSITRITEDFQYITSDEWGLDDAEAARRGMDEQPGNQPYVFFHHTAGATPDLSAQVWDDDPIAWMREVDRRAREQSNYKAFVYSSAVHMDPDGLVSLVEGRGKYYPGATRDMNTVSKAIVMVGYFHPGHSTSRKPTIGELDAVRWQVEMWRRDGSLSPTCEMLPHRHNPKHPGATACFGDFNMPHLDYLRLPLPHWPSFTAPAEPEPTEDLVTTIFIVHGAAARFVATTDARGVATVVSWLPTEADEQKFVAVGAKHKEIPMSALKTTRIAGGKAGLPFGDPYHTWTGNEFLGGAA